jgi:hypothetical protein
MIIFGLFRADGKENKQHFSGFEFIKDSNIL